MLRSFNYTGRKRITRHQCNITLRKADDGSQVFDAELNLSDLQLPEDANIYTEAYYQTAWQRFVCGTIGVPKALKHEPLTEFDSDDPVRFRVKVIDEHDDSGLILALVEGIRPSTDEDGRDALLDVSFRDLGSEIWRLRWTGDEPILEFNNQIPNCRHIVRRDPIFHAYVLPAVFREILFRAIVFHEGCDAEEGSKVHDWIELGMAFAGERLESYEEGEVEKLDEWLDLAVEGFTRQFNFRENLISQVSEV